MVSKKKAEVSKKQKLVLPIIAIVGIVAIVAIVGLLLAKTASSPTMEEQVEVVDEEGNLIGEAFRVDYADSLSKTGSQKYSLKALSNTVKTSKIKSFVARVQVGDACTRDHECSTGDCRVVDNKKVCVDSNQLPDQTQGCYDYGGQRDGQCAEGVCAVRGDLNGLHLSSCQSRVNLANGELCFGSEQCQSGFCGAKSVRGMSEYRCIDPNNRPTGYWCDSDNQCEQGSVCGALGYDIQCVKVN